MADSALTVVTPGVPTVTTEQVAIVKGTIAQEATDAELQLFFFDCARHGVHPLDRLIHFTKRKGKYTPITSIDFLRMRAADSGEYAGNDDAVLTGTPRGKDFAASVTVYRVVKGQRYPFTATARWDEYVPDHPFMWNKMPHMMVSKCAEALALRKAFPKQLAGLYIKEEMEQADNRPLQKNSTPSPGAVLATESAPESGAGAGAPVPPANLNTGIPEAWQPFVQHDRQTGAIVDIKTEEKPGRKSGTTYTKTTVVLDNGMEFYTLDLTPAATAIALKNAGDRVTITSKETSRGNEIVTIGIAGDTAF